MEIMYTEETLYVNLLDSIDALLVSKLQSRVFKIIDDYDVSNIVVNILNDSKYDISLLDKFIKNYQQKYEGIVKIN